MARTRCEWAASESLVEYHDREWGVPLHDDRRLFEMLTLEGAQAGLSWQTILNKRDGYRRLFEDFDPAKVARFGKRDFARLMKDPSIVRNRLKIESTIDNARTILMVQKEFGSLDAYLWDFVEQRPIVNRFRGLKELPAQTDLSRRISKELKRRGFRFVGPTVIYAFLQAAGFVNDHVIGCYRWEQLA